MAHTKAIRSSIQWSDHRLVRSKMKLQLKNRIHWIQAVIHKKVDVGKLKDPIIQTTLVDHMDNMLLIDSPAPINEESAWTSFHNLVYNAAVDVLGYAKWKHRDWFDENDPQIKPLLYDLHSAHSAWLKNKNSSPMKDKYTRLRREAQCKVR